MLKNLRRALAEWLAPDMAFKAKRFHNLRSKMSDAYWWLGEFPDASDTLRWALDTEADSARAIGSMPINKLPSSISDFREHLRRRANGLYHE